MDFLSTVKGSLLEGFYPAGWDFKKIDECCEKGLERETFWHKDFTPVECDNINDFDTYMGHEIETKIEMLECHVSQMKWMRDHDNLDFADFVRTSAKYRGYQCGVPYAEAFTSCLAWLKLKPMRLLP